MSHVAISLNVIIKHMVARLSLSPRISSTLKGKQGKTARVSDATRRRVTCPTSVACGGDSSFRTHPSLSTSRTRRIALSATTSTSRSIRTRVCLIFHISTAHGALKYALRFLLTVNTQLSLSDHGEHGCRLQCAKPRTPAYVSSPTREFKRYSAATHVCR